MTYAGSCHCGAVTFEVAGDPPATAISCNCSHCRDKGLLLGFAPASDFRLVSGEGALATYRFNTGQIAHRFCTTCGVQPFSEGTGPDGVEVRAINLRCVTGLDLDALTIQPVDGASR